MLKDFSNRRIVQNGKVASIRMGILHPNEPSDSGTAETVLVVALMEADPSKVKRNLAAKLLDVRMVHLSI